MEKLDVYLSGEKLYGDDFTLEQIEEWYEDEKEGYANLGAQDRSSYRYVYHSLNSFYGYRHLGKRKFNNVLGLGSAYGDEFLPIIQRIKNLTILEPSDAFVNTEIHGVPCNYFKPTIDGKMPFDDGSFDLITCLGVLHHIPNCTTVTKEIFRCLANGGYALIREPIVSMGDWSKSRGNLTKRERGIPIAIFRDIISEAGFEVKHQHLCVFPIIPKICCRIGIAAYNNHFLTYLDSILSRILRFNVCYHSTRLLQKFRPTSVYFVLYK